nr:MAG TPA: hypothetical protein [Caudoviricetes sp.]
MFLNAGAKIIHLFSLRKKKIVLFLAFGKKIINKPIFLVLHLIIYKKDHIITYHSSCTYTALISCITSYTPS